MKKLHSIFLLLITASCAYAQQSITGIVKDDAATIAFATVSLLNATDSTWVQSELTGDDGKFKFSDVKEGKYLLDTRFLGYDKNVQLLTKYEDIEITLVRSTSKLSEVVVKSKAPIIQPGLGKTTVNFEQAAISAGASVLELLRKAPGVVVDGNGNVSMNGKGVLITIDDKQTYMSGEDLVNYLRSLPAEQVAQFDLMSQPSARYDAEGNTGIINIKTRKSRKAGLSGNVALSGSYGEYPSTHNSANVTYRKDKLTLQVNTGYLLGNGFLRKDLVRTASNEQTQVIESRVTQKSVQQETFEDYSLKLSADYAASEKLTIGGGVQGIYHPNDQFDVSRATITDNVAGTEIYNISENDRGFQRHNINTVASAKYVPAKDHSITIDANYMASRQRDGQLLEGKNYIAGQEVPGGVTFKTDFPITRDVYVLNADYTVKVNEYKLEAGIKSSYLDNVNGSFYEVRQNDVWMYDSTRSNNYLYRENINAAYVSIGKELSERWQAQVGMRVENTNINGTQQMNSQTFNRSLTSCFPTAFVSYKASDKHSFELNGGRRINRPSYRDLNPFVFYLSQYSSSAGNPDLLPAFRYSIELKHNYHNKLLTSLSAKRVVGLINDVTLYDAVTKAVHYTIANNANKYVATFSISYNQEILPWWTLMSSYDWYYSDYQDYDGNVLGTSHGHSFAINNQFNYKGWSIDTIYAFNSGDLQSTIERNGPSHWMNASISKKIWKDTATVKLSANDPFDVYRYNSVQQSNGIAIASGSQFATRQYSLGFTYNIGKRMDNVREYNNKSEEAHRM